MYIKNLSSAIIERVIEIRRDFHMNPEIAGEEKRTPYVISDILAEIGLEVTRNVGNNGVVGLLRGGKPGKTVALRADIDALPITEAWESDFRSKNDGKMHACGHDGHTAIALGTAMVLSQMKDELCGNVKFIFQPAEEKAPDGGAKFMIKDGVLDDVDAIFGLHLWPSLTVGQIGFRYGGLMASSDPFEITIKGKSTHASEPQNGIDATLAAAQFVSALQGIVSRQIGPLDSAVVTVGCLNSGTVYNVVSDCANIRGTVRTLEKDIRDSMENRIKTMLDGVCSAYGATGELNYHYGYPPLINYREMVDIAKHAAINEFGEQCVLNIERSALGGEDFAFYLEKKQGAFLWLGCSTEGDDSVMPIHNPKFHIDEKCLPLGVRLMSSIAIEFLNGEK